MPEFGKLWNERKSEGRKRERKRVGGDASRGRRRFLAERRETGTTNYNILHSQTLHPTYLMSHATLPLLAPFAFLIRTILRSSSSYFSISSCDAPPSSPTSSLVSFDDGRREAIEEGSCSSGILVLLLGAFLIPPMTDDETYNEHNDSERSNPSARHDVDDDNDDDDFRRLSLTSRASDAMVVFISLCVCVLAHQHFFVSLSSFTLLTPILFRPKYRQKISRITLLLK